ncbi:MAG: hypothetical protein ACFE9C_17110 [Candidatus Hodarchaeota archaeon]
MSSQVLSILFDPPTAADDIKLHTQVHICVGQILGSMVLRR